MQRTDAEELLALLEEQKRRAKDNRLHALYRTRYNWQLDYIGATRSFHETALIAANRVGKTETATMIDAFHLSGEYPEDWPGHRFAHAPTCWALGFSMEKTRDLIQTPLFGAYRHGTGFEGGLIPAARIISWESAPGTPNAMRTVRVQHATGATSAIQFWSYSQGQHAMMGDCVDWFHIDEEPRDQTIRPQVLTRTVTGDNGRGGRGQYTFTPENGRTDLVVQLLDNPSPSQFCMQVGWDQAPHITPETAERLLASYPEHQRDMRTKGVPMLGHGRIYDFADDFLLCDPVPIEDHWFVINGMDFGYDHPQAHIQLVEDRDNGIFYVNHSYRVRKASATDAWGAVRGWARDIPTAWPHDGLQHEKGRDDAKQQRTHYSEAGWNMLGMHAKWPQGGHSVESGIYEIRDLMSRGQFRIFRGQHDLMNELRQYHRDERGNIVKLNDDLLSAVRYAYMMRRYAVQYGEIGKPGKVISFAGWGG